MKGMLAAVFLVLGLVSGATAQTQPQLAGNLFIHDPSVIAIDGRFASFATGVEHDKARGLPRTKTSPDGITWSETGAIPGGIPAWVPAELGYTPLNIWAPSVSARDGTVFLYYAASQFGYQDSAVGLMTNTAFDSAHPAAGWVDQGLVIRSRKGDDFNAIDPFRVDTGDGRAWLVFGSYWQGIYLFELDPKSGKRLDPNGEMAHLASRNGGAIEAPAILAHEGHFYLFVSFDICCRGAASTYRIMVGRADAIQGPYVDRDGKPMLEGGATELMAEGGRVAGAGGQEVFRAGGEDTLVYHFYDRASMGMPTLQLAPLRWDAEGWPTLDPLP
jgi:arabinan endo-1,5-alpha-L-arabinosidase